MSAGTLSAPPVAGRRISVASLHGAFRLRSGQVSTTYFDKYRFEGQPDLLKRVAADPGHISMDWHPAAAAIAE